MFQIPVALGDKSEPLIGVAELIDNKLIIITLKSEDLVHLTEGLEDTDQIERFHINITFIPALRVPEE